VSSDDAKSCVWLVGRRLLKAGSSVNISEEMVEAKKQGGKLV